MARDYNEYLRTKFRRAVWNALEGVAFEFADVDDATHEQLMEEAVEYFMIHFYPDVNY